ncbi:GDSL-type esterase/lipase family protein [Haloimpatiens sp. FM7330]|uniref:GDSL-type esterase/lipase family protein n=1 Tax=Haloimpatiens sp. FM7330 TaxID=3298610 RepID=UPI0036407392
MRRYRRKKMKLVNPKKLIVSSVIFIVLLVVVGTSVKKYMKKDSNTKNKSVKVSSNNYSNKKIDTSKKNSENQKKHDNIDISIPGKENNDLNKKETTKETNKENNKEKNETNNKSNKNRSNKEFFKNSVFIGDSITEGITFYDILDEKHVVAVKGSTINQAYKKISKVSALKPKNIFILLGTNDLTSGMNSTEFISNYEKLVESLREKLPNSNIYIQSILPVQEKAEKRNPNLANSRINEFNKAIMNMVRNKNLNYLNIASVLKNNDNLYEYDGIHLKYQFDKLWLDYIKDNI